MLDIQGRKKTFHFTICCGPFGTVCHRKPVTSVAEIKSIKKLEGQTSVGV